MVKKMRGSEYLNQQKARFKKKANTGLFQPNIESIRAFEQAGFLFHGHPGNKPVRKLKTNASPLDMKKVVFAGMPWVGISFLARWNDELLTQWTSDGIPYMALRAGKFEDLYKSGGTLYAVSPESFISTPEVTGYEFVSYSEVVPESSVFIQDPVSLLRNLGVNLIEDKTKKVSIYSKWVK
jgi:hypothetical protein